MQVQRLRVQSSGGEDISMVHVSVCNWKVIDSVMVHIERSDKRAKKVGDGMGSICLCRGEKR